MNKLFLLSCVTILFLIIVSCSGDNDPQPAPSITNSQNNIPSKYHGRWNIKYKDNVDISISQSYFKFTATDATLALNTYTYQNGVINIQENSFTFSAGYEDQPIEQIVLIKDIKIEIRTSQNYVGYLEFLIKQAGKDPITYIAKKE